MGMTEEEYESLPWLHIYGQHFQHDGAKIIGTKDSLRALRDALDAAISDGTTEVEMIAADGDGYGLRIERTNRTGLDHAPLPYIDDH